MKKKKIIKWILIVAIISCILTLVSFAGISLFAKMYKQAEYKRAVESGVYYMIGKGCSNYYNFSERELIEKVKEELNCCVDKNRFENIIEEEQQLYSSSKDSTEIKKIKEEYKNKTGEEWKLGEQCNILRKRISKILNDLK